MGLARGVLQMEVHVMIITSVLQGNVHVPLVVKSWQMAKHVPLTIIAEVVGAMAIGLLDAMGLARNALQKEVDVMIIISECEMMFH